jgi:hypothetical protein
VIIGAAVLTWEATKYDRLGWLDETLSTLAEADKLFVIDNGSAPATADAVRTIARKHGARFATHDHDLHTCEHGTNLRAAVLEAAGVTVSVISDDDILWRPGWRDALEAWWSEAPPNLAITGCHLEPDYPWNESYGHLTLGGRIGKLRASTGSGTWSFRNWRDIGPLHENVQGWGDVPACKRLRSIGRDIAQIDLAEHRGEHASTWGNVSHLYAEGET